MRPTWNVSRRPWQRPGAWVLAAPLKIRFHSQHSTAQQVPAVRNERLQGPQLQERSAAGWVCFGVAAVTLRLGTYLPCQAQVWVNEWSLPCMDFSGSRLARSFSLSLIEALAPPSRRGPAVKKAARSDAERLCGLSGC